MAQRVALEAPKPAPSASAQASITESMANTMFRTYFKTLDKKQSKKPKQTLSQRIASASGASAPPPSALPSALDEMKEIKQLCRSRSDAPEILARLLSTGHLLDPDHRSKALLLCDALFERSKDFRAALVGSEDRLRSVMPRGKKESRELNELAKTIIHSWSNRFHVFYPVLKTYAAQLDRADPQRVQVLGTLSPPPAVALSGVSRRVPGANHRERVLRKLVRDVQICLLNPHATTLEGDVAETHQQALDRLRVIEDGLRELFPDFGPSEEEGSGASFSERNGSVAAAGSSGSGASFSETTVPNAFSSSEEVSESIEWENDEEDDEEATREEALTFAERVQHALSFVPDDYKLSLTPSSATAEQEDSKPNPSSLLLRDRPEIQQSMAQAKRVLTMVVRPEVKRWIGLLRKLREGAPWREEATRAAEALAERIDLRLEQCARLGV